MTASASSKPSVVPERSKSAASMATGVLMNDGADEIRRQMLIHAEPNISDDVGCVRRSASPHEMAAGAGSHGRGRAGSRRRGRLLRARDAPIETQLCGPRLQHVRDVCSDRGARVHQLEHRFLHQLLVSPLLKPDLVLAPLLLIGKLQGQAVVVQAGGKQDEEGDEQEHDRLPRVARAVERCHHRVEEREQLPEHIEHPLKKADGEPRRRGRHRPDPLQPAPLWRIGVSLSLGGAPAPCARARAAGDVVCPRPRGKSRARGRRRRPRSRR
mmetsp:Transcript_75879/g.227751  ORF Transcript_75879/g.227751 Transcript_75879/m.227751 type:complete len:270 (+) Transcript_75879:97-906(+)